MITALDVDQYVDGTQIRALFRGILLGQYFDRVARLVWAQNGQYEYVALQEVYKSIMFQPQTFPCAEVNLVRSRNLDPGTDAIRLMHEISLFFHHRGDNEEQLEDMVNLWLKAARLFFMKEQVYLEEVGLGPIKLGDDSFSPFVAAAEYNARPFIKSGLLTLELENIY